MPPTPPGPRGGRLVGNLEAFERDRLTFLVNAHAQYGDIVRFDKRTTLIAGHQMANEILVRRRSEFVIRENFLQERIPIDELDAWTTVRRLLNPALRQRMIDRFMQSLIEVADTMFAERQNRPASDAVSVIEQITARGMARYYFGQDGDAASIPDRASKLLDELAKVIGNPFSLSARFQTPTRRRIARAADSLRQQIAGLLEKRWARPGEHDDLAAYLAMRVDPSDLELKARLPNLILGSLLAGHRVPAAATGWLLHLVTATTDRQFLDRLRSEAFKFVRCPGSLTDYPHAQATVMESLRLFPPTWLISRTALDPFRLAGYEFPENHVLLVSPYVLHRDPRIFSRPDEFSPRRWLEPTSLPTSYIPFGLGPRSCPGSHLAMATMVVVLLVAMGHYTVRTSGDPVADPRTTLLPRGLQLSVSAGVGGLAQGMGEALPRGLPRGPQGLPDVCPRDLALPQYIDPHQQEVLNLVSRLGDQRQRL